MQREVGICNNTDSTLLYEDDSAVLTGSTGRQDPSEKKDTGDP